MNLIHFFSLPTTRSGAYAAGPDTTAPEEIVANVWGRDPSWCVYWYEDGERRGMMSRRIGTDPLSELLHKGSIPATNSSAVG